MKIGAGASNFLLILVVATIWAGLESAGVDTFKFFARRELPESPLPPKLWIVPEPHRPKIPLRMGDIEGMLKRTVDYHFVLEHPTLMEYKGTIRNSGFRYWRIR